jgi:Flp pilus assembly protein TadG
MHVTVSIRCPRRRGLRGQSLVETALVLPVLLLVVGGIIQFGILFWSQNTLTQVARDTGRWAATDQSCNNAAIVTQANAIAAQSSLFGYTPGSWTASNVVVTRSGAACPPTSNTSVAWVQITINHQVPILLPWIPGNGNLTTSVQYRMEPISPS